MGLLDLDFLFSFWLTFAVTYSRSLCPLSESKKQLVINCLNYFGSEIIYWILAESYIILLMNSNMSYSRSALDIWIWKRLFLLMSMYLYNLFLSNSNRFWCFLKWYFKLFLRYSVTYTLIFLSTSAIESLSICSISINKYNDFSPLNNLHKNVINFLFALNTITVIKFSIWAKLTYF